VVREGVGARGEMTQALYAHMNNKKIKIKKERKAYMSTEQAVQLCCKRDNGFLGDKH
jgi:hypothetical protein